MVYQQKLNCSEWQFGNIPEFTGGKMQPLFADCGTGLSKVPEWKTTDNSFMHTFCGATAESIAEYAKLLESEGFKKVFENRIEDNLFYQFTAPDGLLWISFLKNSGTARFILDRCRMTDTESFGYSDCEQTKNNTELVQYSLFYDKMIKGTSCDCGMNYVYRLHDNSLIIIDGGEFEQSTDIAVADYLKFLHELTGTDETEKLRVSLWICTHAHNDHCDFMSKLLRFYSDKFSIERITFNFPNPQNTKHSPSINALKQRLMSRFPNAQYIKPHAGCRFDIANAEIEFLVSAEDAVGIEEDDDDPFPGTNSTSMIFKIIADGVSTFFLADCGEDNGSVLIENYSDKITDCAVLQAAHHGINRIYDVYERLNADYVMLPQCRMNMNTRFSEVYKHLCKRYGEDRILFANDATDIFTLEGGKYSIRKRAQVGTMYDKSQW